MSAPWYARTRRWGQTNLTEVEPARYDREKWRRHWAATAVDGLIVNAGGIVAFYPSDFPLQRRARGIDDRDLLAEIVADARSAGLAVLARMDSNRADGRFLLEHPDWFCRDAAGEPLRAGDKFVSCINSAYYDEYLPDVFREIIAHVGPDGFADNSWAGLERSRICHCDNCARSFRERTARALPTTHDPADESYRAWVEWNYARRIEVWRANNAATSRAGGEHCRWIGMIGGDLGYNRERFVDVRAIARETPLILLDHQRRVVREGFAQNAEVGLRIASVLGCGGRYAESMPMYQLGGPVFRLAAMPEPEARLWVTQGIAGGIAPWWHHIGSEHDDRRQYATAAPLFQWHREHERDLVDREPIASVAVVWSRRNNDIAGGDDFPNRVAAAYRGAWQALSRARIPYLPVHADDIGTLPPSVRTLVLPDVAVMSDMQVEAVRAFSAAGGAIVASGDTSRFDDEGRQREDFALADLLGVRATGRELGGTTPVDDDIEISDRHTYLRIDGAPGARWEALERLGDTDVIGFGGRLTVVDLIDVDAVPLRFIPAFPIYPPETSWMRAADSDLPGLVVREAHDGRGRVAYLAADLDRCWGRDELPDHADVLAGIIEWAADSRPPVRVAGRGRLNVVPWRTAEQRVVVHIVNTTATAQHAGRQGDLIPSGELAVEVDGRLLDADRVEVTALVDGWSLEVDVRDGVVRIDVPPVTDHEVLTIGGVEGR